MLPNFMIIGAAKAGTTALYWYFSDHPEVFMSRVKETNYFAYALDERGRLLYGDPDMHHFPVTTLAEYRQLFADAGNAVAIGEASPLYLESPHAAARIHQQLPEVKLICCLRHPVDRAYSDYLMYLRSRGRRLDPVGDLTPTAAWARPESHWMRIGRYHEQLSRYFEQFPRDQICVFEFDELKKSPVELMRRLYRFVGVDPSFTPDFDTPHNVGGMPANRFLEGMFTSPAIKAALEPLIPRRAIDWVRWLRTRNMRPAPELPADLRQELTSYFREDLMRTSELIGRSLDHWLQPARRKVS